MFVLKKRLLSPLLFQVMLISSSFKKILFVSTQESLASVSKNFSKASSNYSYAMGVPRKVRSYSSYNVIPQVLPVFLLRAEYYKAEK